MRAKFKVVSVKRTESSELLNMTPVGALSYGENGENEDNDFARYTPVGNLEICVTNPDLLGVFNPGDTYYLDFTKA